MTPALARELARVADRDADEISYGPPPWLSLVEVEHGVAHEWRERGRDAAQDEAQRLYGVSREWYAVAAELDARRFRAGAAAQLRRGGPSDPWHVGARVVVSADYYGRARGRAGVVARKAWMKDHVYVRLDMRKRERVQKVDLTDVKYLRPEVQS